MKTNEGSELTDLVDAKGDPLVRKKVAHKKELKQQQVASIWDLF